MGEDFPAAGCAVVFGGTGGIGARTADLLAARGTDVVLTYRSNAAKADEVVAAVQGHGRQGTAVACDATDRDAVQAVVDGALERHGSIHTVVSAGGIVMRTIPLRRIEADEFRGVVDTDVIGFFNIAHATIPVLREDGGSITALITCAVDRTTPTDGLSAIPKAAVTMMVKQIATEEAHKGVRANVVGPGVIDGGVAHAMRQDEQTNRLLDNAVQLTPMRREGTETEVAEAVVFLASAKAGYITGQTINVDGGLTA